MKKQQLQIISLICLITVIESFSPPRHVCLFERYSSVEGPYFQALIDQMLEQAECPQSSVRVAVCTTSPNQSYGSKLQSKLDYPSELCILEEYNPLQLEKRILQLDPSIIWVMDDNAHRIRYRMRTSGLDKIIERLCGPSHNTDDQNKVCLYVGECGGAISAGSSLRNCGHDPKEAREPQFFGLNLLGNKKSIAFRGKKDDDETKSTTDSMEDIYLRDGQVYIWSQTANSVNTFIMTPSNRGAIEQWQSPDPLPPLLEDINSEGVFCTGEPSIDPSRRMQDSASEWINEESL